MKGTPKVHEYKSVRTLAQRLRSDIMDFDCILLFAYNRTGKTRLSMEFKDQGKRKGNGQPDTLYFNAYTEDLFVWENDLDSDLDRHISINQKSSFLQVLTQLALDESIAGYLARYADFDFDIDYTRWRVTFRKDDAEQIKISRGEQNIFVWCVFMAICERIVDGDSLYSWVKYIYIDDPISSLDDNNAISVACDLAALLRNAVERRDANGAPDPLRCVFSSHHGLFFNVMCNELGRPNANHVKVKTKRLFLHRPDATNVYTLRSTEDTPYFHHVATLADLRHRLNSGDLYTYHFNALRSTLEKISSFFGHEDLKFCLQGLKDEALYNRAINLLSHGKYSFADPHPMGEDNQKLFQQILDDVLKRYEFALPELAAKPPKQKATQ